VAAAGLPVELVLPDHTVGLTLHHAHEDSGCSRQGPKLGLCLGFCGKTEIGH
jgi:hypothetical protein